MDKHKTFNSIVDMQLLAHRHKSIIHIVTYEIIAQSNEVHKEVKHSSPTNIQDNWLIL